MEYRAWELLYNTSKGMHKYMKYIKQKMVLVVAIAHFSI